MNQALGNQDKPIVFKKYKWVQMNTWFAWLQFTLQQLHSLYNTLQAKCSLEFSLYTNKASNNPTFHQNIQKLGRNYSFSMARSGGLYHRLYIHQVRLYTANSKMLPCSQLFSYQPCNLFSMQLLLIILLCRPLKKQAWGRGYAALSQLE